MTVVYLDYNATAPVRPEVLDAMHDALQAVGNASSVHGPGRAARARLDNARDAVARLVNAAPREVYFTSGGTEANYLALRGLPAITRPGQVAVSAIEHDAVLHAAPEGCHRIPVGQDGIVDLSAFEQMLGRDRNREIGLVSVMLANNETGAVQPVAEIARLAHAHGACLHCDGVQAAGKIAIDMPTLGADMLSLSAHKLGGPQGVGALVIRNELALRAVQRGGGQERGLRGGTENIPGIAGFGVAADAAGRGLVQMAALAELRDRLETGIAALAPETVFFGQGVERLPNTANFALAGARSEMQLMRLDLSGIAVSAGSACASGKVARSHVLTAMGVAPALADCALRVSLGWQSVPADVETFLSAWAEIAAPETLKKAG